MIRAKLRAFIFNIDKENDFFYGKFQGGRRLSLLKKLLIILLDLRTFKDFLLYHNNPVIVSTFGKSERKDHGNLSADEQDTLETLKSDGIVFLDGYFKDQVDNLIKDNVEEDKSSQNNHYFYNDIEQSNEFFHILNDPSLIKIASEYYGTKSFYRYRPNVNFTNPARDDLDSRAKMVHQEQDDFADDWHVDSIYNLQYHILLRDVIPGETRRLFANDGSVGFFDRFCG